MAQQAHFKKMHDEKISIYIDAYTDGMNKIKNELLSKFPTEDDIDFICFELLDNKTPEYINVYSKEKMKEIANFIFKKLKS